MDFTRKSNDIYFASLFGLILKDSFATSKCVYIHTYILNVGNYKEKVQFSSKGKKKKRKNDVINNELSGSRGANLYFFCRQFTVQFVY